MSDSPSVHPWAKEELVKHDDSRIEGAYLGRAAMFKVNGIEFFLLARASDLDTVANLIFPDNFEFMPENAGNAFISGMRGYKKVSMGIPPKSESPISATSPDENEIVEKIEPTPVKVQEIVVAGHVEAIQAMTPADLNAAIGPGVMPQRFEDVDADKFYEEGQAAFRAEGHQAVCPHTFTEAGCAADHWQSGFENARVNDEL
jgi:hypothetical protein